MSTPSKKNLKARFGSRLRELRELRGLTQEELAKKLGMSGGQAAVSKWESGTGLPGARNLEKLAAALDVPSDVLLDPKGGETHLKVSTVIDPELARRVVEGSRELGPRVQNWLLQEIRAVCVLRGISREEWPEWMKEGS